MTDGGQAFFGFLIFIALGVYVYSRIPKRKKKKRNKKTSIWNGLFETFERPVRRTSPYLVKQSLITDYEKNLFFALGEYVGTKAYICPMVGLKDIFTVEADNWSEYQRLLNKIWRKHVDFVLVTPDANLRILCGIELDDSTHSQRSAREKDLFKDQLFYNAGIPLIRFKVRSYYSAELLNRKLGPVFGISEQ